MTDSYLEKLKVLANSVSRVDLPTEEDWSRFEREANIRLSKDYKEFISYFGTGVFGNTLTLYNPAATGSARRLSKKLLLDHGRTLKFFEEVLGIRFFPDPNCCIPVATMDRRNLLLCRDASGEFSRVTWLDLDVDLVTHTPEHIASFIYKLYVGELHLDWAGEVRAGIWWNEDTPFFSPIVERSDLSCPDRT